MQSSSRTRRSPTGALVAVVEQQVKRARDASSRAGNSPAGTRRRAARGPDALAGAHEPLMMAAALVRNAAANLSRAASAQRGATPEPVCGSADSCG